MAKNRESKDSRTGREKISRLLDLLGIPSAILALVGLLMVVLAGLLYLWIDDLRPFSLTIIIGGAFLTGLALITSFAQVRSAVTGRRGRYATLSTAMIASFVTIVILLNFISYQISIGENPPRLDITATKQFSLSEQTKKILSNLKEDIQATAFYTPEEAAIQLRAEDLLSEFARRSRGKFTYRIFDPERDRSTAQRYNISVNSTIVFEAVDSKRQHAIFTDLNGVPIITEQDFISALLIITGEKQKKVYFLTGHGEHDAFDIQGDPTSFGFASRALIGDNYTWDTVNIQEKGEIPEDAAVLVIAGPKRDLQEAREAILNRPATPSEIDILFNWLKDGGRAIFLLDPGAPKTFTDMLANWGIALEEGTIVDTDSSIFGDPRTPLVQRFQYAGTLSITQGAPPITEPLETTFFPEATSIKPSLDPNKIPPWITYYPLAFTSGSSWLTKDPIVNDLPEGGERGSRILAMAVAAFSTVDQEPAPTSTSSPSATTGITTLIVIGDSDFATNRYFSAVTNGDLFLNSVNWLTNDYQLISIRPKPQVFRDLILTRGEYNFIRYSSWFLLPIAVATFGILSWWRRQLGP